MEDMTQKLIHASEAAAGANEKVKAMEEALNESKRMVGVFQSMFETVCQEKNEMLKKIVDAYAKGWA